MNRSAIGLFDLRSDAERAVASLERDGFAANDITLLDHDDLATKRRGFITPVVDGDHLRIMPVIGMIVGGIAGLFAALLFLDAAHGGARFAGAFFSIVGGIGFGGALGVLVGMITGAGIPGESVENYEEALAQGGTLVVVVPKDRVRLQRAADVLWANGAVDLEHRLEALRAYARA